MRHKSFVAARYVLLVIMGFAISSIAFAQTGAPPSNTRCVNVFKPGVIIDLATILALAPPDVPPLESAGVIARIESEVSEEDTVGLTILEFAMDENDRRGIVCIFFEFQDFADENPDATRVSRIEQVVDLDDEDTDCELPDDLRAPNATFTLDIYDDDADPDEPLTEDEIIDDFSGENDEDSVDEPILIVTNIEEPQRFDISLIFCDETPEDDPETEIDESEEPPEFVEVVTIEEYCKEIEDAIAAARPGDEEIILPDICDELITRPQNRPIFVVHHTDGYFNYSVDQ